MAERALRGHGRFHHSTGRYRAIPFTDLEGWRGAAAAAFCAFPVVVGFAAPFALLLAQATAHVGEAFASSFWMAVRNSIAVAAAGAAVTVALGLALAYARRVAPNAVVRVAVRGAGLGYAVPGTVLAVLAYFAWPLAAVFSKHICYIDAPLVILGRTYKSWGSMIVLSNPGKEQIAKMIADNDQNRDWVPLKNFTLTNLMAEGLLLGKKLFPEELRPYPFDEQQYLRRTMRELRHRLTLGVDVNREICEVLTYAEKYPGLKAELSAPAEEGPVGLNSSVRRLARTLKLNHVRRHVDILKEKRKIARGEVNGGFTVSGDDFGFHDALECAAFISKVTAR